MKVPMTEKKSKTKRKCTVTRKDFRLGTVQRK